MAGEQREALELLRDQAELRRLWHPMGTGGLLLVVFDSSKMVDLATYGAFAVALIAMAAAVVRWSWQRARAGRAGAAGDDGVERAVDRLRGCGAGAVGGGGSGPGLAGPDPSK
jgi:hypothetical protein